MQVNQIYNIVNDITGEILGETAVISEDLSNIVDIGTAVFNANAVDNYVRNLVNHIGKVIFVNRSYRGSAPSVLMNGWEYGSVMEKIRAELPEAEENESWNLQDGTSYDPNIFYKPQVSAKFFNKRTTFEIPMSFTELQVKESFSNAEQLNGFISMLNNNVEKSLTVKMDSLIMRTINNFIGETIYSEVGGGSLSGRSGTKAVNLLYLYNQTYNPTPALTVAEALHTPEFLRFASFVITNYIARISKLSKLFNIGSTDKFTPKDVLHLVALSDYVNASNMFLQSDVYHNELTELPNFEVVPYWQGSGTGYAFSDISSINVTTASGNAINASGILAVMFDRDALGVCNVDRRVTTNYNPKAEFFNNWFKFDSQYFNDTDENFLVFYIA